MKDSNIEAERQQVLAEVVLAEVKGAGYDFAFGAAATYRDARFSRAVLREALLSGRITPDTLSEMFITSVLENLQLDREDVLAQRREARIERALKTLHAEKIMPVFSMLPLEFHQGNVVMKAAGTRSPKELMRDIAEKLVDAICGKADGLEG